MIQGLSKEKECQKRKRKKDISSDDSLNTSEEEETSHSKVSLLIIIIDLIYTCMFQRKKGTSQQVIQHYIMVIFNFKLLNNTSRGGRVVLPVEMTPFVPLKKRCLKVK